MKWFCGLCGSFTTFRLTERQRRAFESFNLNSLKCPRCNTHTVILHEDCAKMGAGVDQTPACAQCVEFFNCFTGNADDGTTDNIQIEQDEIRIRAEAVMRMEHDELVKLHTAFSHYQIKVFSMPDKTSYKLYVKYKGTTWRLDWDDYDALADRTYKTHKSTLICRVLDKLELNKTKFNNYLRLVLTNQLRGMV